MRHGVSFQVECVAMARVGRPRSETSRESILRAALELARSEGLRKLTIEETARRAGVGKQTIYRWWKSRGDLILEALREFSVAEIPRPDEGTLEADLGAFFAATFERGARIRGLTNLLRALISEAQLDEDFGRRFSDQLIKARRAALRDVLMKGRSRGEMSARADSEFLIDIGFGVMWYRLLTRVGPVDDELARTLAHAVAVLAKTPKQNAHRRRISRTGAGDR